MTIDELIAEMPKDGWFIRRGGALRREASRDDEEWGLLTVECCPITSGIRGRGPRDADDYDTEGEALGVSRSDVATIINAADKDSDFDPALRDRLLAAVGLKEPTP